MKKNLIKFVAQLAVVGVLATIGFIALCSEPAENVNFLKVFAGQITVAVLTLTSAILLGRKWQITRKLTYTGLFQ